MKPHPASKGDPCWTGLASGSVCHRGGIGCPLPHPDDPADLWNYAEKNVWATKPPMTYAEAKDRLA